MYIDANAPDVGPATAGFSIHPMANAEQPTDVDCFNAQIGLWVQETVADNLMRANEQALSRLPTEHRNVLFAPVKHLMSISVANAPYGDPRPVGPAAADGEPDVPQTDVGAIRGGAGKAPAEAPQEPAEQTPSPEESTAGVPMDPAATIERDYALSPSGRPRNTPFYDAVAFKVMLRCDARMVPYVVEQLQAESFLTVLNIEMIAVDPAVAAQQGYVYGDRPVMQLSMQCEIPFMRAWLVPLMPPGLQAALAARAQQ